MNKDRFQNITDDYSELMSEVFAELGFSYDKFEAAVLEWVKKLEPNFLNLPILDIGIGEGETAAPFLQVGCTNLTGIDINPQMLAMAQERFGSRVRLMQMDAVDLNFAPKEFSIAISGMSIHNIARRERKKFWEKFAQLSPKIFVFAEKIADPDPEKHSQYLQNDLAAIRKVYGERHHLPDMEREWLEHYAYDEREKLEVGEIEENLGRYYELRIVLEEGMGKVIVGVKK